MCRSYINNPDYKEKAVETNSRKEGGATQDLDRLTNNDRAGLL
jgi:hypothetical protein